MAIFFGFLTATLAAGLAATWIFLIVDSLLPETDITVRLAGGICGFYWILSWGFQVLALTGGFRLGVILVLVSLLAVMGAIQRQQVAERLGLARQELGGEISSLWDELKRSKWVAVSLGLVGLHVAVRMMRTLATPAFGWDDFTYHLFRAGSWVQNGGIALEPAPDAWTYYEFFPWGGDLLWAWAMVWGVGDTLVPIAAILLWCAVPALAYAVVRELERGRVTAAVVAMAIGVIPSQAGQISTAYVDNAVLAMVLGASLFLLVYLRSEADGRSATAALFVGACLGLGLLVKTSFLPLALPAFLIVLWSCTKTRRPRDLVAFGLGSLVAAPNLIFNWCYRGSPFYPFEIVSFLPHNEQHSWILSKYGEGATAPELARAAKALAINLFPLDPFLNVGILGVVLIGLGIVGSVQLTKTSRGRWFLFWVASGAVLTIVSFFSPRNSSMVVWWTLMMGRFLVPSLAGLMIASCLVPFLWLRIVLIPVMVIEYFVYARRGWPTGQLVATIQVAALVGLIVLLAFVLQRWIRKPIPLWLSVSAATSLVLLGVVGIREGYRYEAYRLFAERELLDFHGAPPASAWPIWERLNETGPHRVAATAGFDGLTGHNWFRGPLQGAWLQNEVVYLPINTDGDLVSYRDPRELLQVADHMAWLLRIQEQKVDRIVALGPANIEHRWILDLTDIFAIEISMGNDHFLLAKVNQEALSRLLSTAP